MQPDVIIVGAGIAGASAGYWLAKRGRVLLLERESQPGYHATGRSAALFAETYGTPLVRALTRASRAFYERPPEGFAEYPLLLPRGVMFVAQRGDEPQLASLLSELGALDPRIRAISAADACRRVPALEPRWVGGAIVDEAARDIDVHGLHQGYLRGIRRAGGEVLCGVDIVALEPRAGGWRVRAADGREWQTPLLANAAGAWCDSLAELAGLRPLGLEPRRRSAFTFRPPAGFDVGRWPAVIDARERFYFKPDAGLLLGSPANADPVPPQDVQPEEIDIATAIERIQEASSLRIRRPQHAWAGLRTFAPDGDPVVGFDACGEGFFWIAGQGGYGIQSADAIGRISAALLGACAWPDELGPMCSVSAALTPKRFTP